MKDKSLVRRITGHRLFMPLVCLAIVLLANLLRQPDFFKITVKDGTLYGYVIDVINRGSELVILAVGMTLVVSSSAGTDISVGAIMAVAAAICCFILSGGQVSVNEYANPYVLGVVIALVLGAICGAWNGFLVAKLRIQPMVATLILFTAGRGIAQLITNGQITYIRVPEYKVLGGSISGLPLPVPFFVSLAVVVLAYILLKRTSLGLYIEAVGINPKASRLVGIKSSLIIFLTYAFCGLCAGIAGLVASSRIYSADANNVGLNMELDAILAVALGGNSLGGGKFFLMGSVIGAYTIQALTTTLYAMGVSADQIPVYKAIVVVIIVSLQSEELRKWFKKKFATKKVVESEVA
ncbi:ABC transporter permease [Lachnospiraceae bacterium OttesenSCG-928-J05]|nr:ABC transporter permease [Lachnospiraceae bacterium OttesenSCG-928-J05]